MRLFFCVILCACGGAAVSDAVCGDGVLDNGEACDDGVNGGGYGGCLAGCTALGPHCGDSKVDEVVLGAADFEDGATPWIGAIAASSPGLETSAGDAQQGDAAGVVAEGTHVLLPASGGTAGALRVDMWTYVEAGSDGTATLALVTDVPFDHLTDRAVLATFGDDAIEFECGRDVNRGDVFEEVAAVTDAWALWSIEVDLYADRVLLRYDDAEVCTYPWTDRSATLRVAAVEVRAGDPVLTMRVDAISVQRIEQCDAGPSGSDTCTPECTAL
jgi:hypothetical protein